MTIPETRNALVQSKGVLVPKTLPMPKPESGKVLIRVRAIGLNIGEAKTLDLGFYNPEVEYLWGYEASGEVVALGEGVTNLKIGDSVVASAGGNSYEHPERGSFADYIVALAATTWKTGKQPLDVVEEGTIPSGPVTTYAAAGGIGCAVITLALYFEWFNKTPIVPNTISSDQVYLVWGGSSSVGAVAIQLAKYMGYTVIATASPHNHELVRSLGATAVFDYHDPDVVSQIRSYTDGKLTAALDAIGMPETTKAAYESMSHDLPARLQKMRLDPVPDELKEKHPNVICGFAPAYIAVEKSRKLRPDLPGMVSPEGCLETCQEAFEHVRSVVADSKLLKALPTKIVPGGLSGINDGLDIIRRSENSGTKIVVTL